jgi:hypothetical protein
MVPNAAGDSAIAARLIATASDAAGESDRAAVTRSTRARTDDGSTASWTASARCPSTAR